MGGFFITFTTMFERTVFKAFKKMVADTSRLLKAGDLTGAMLTAQQIDGKPMELAYRKIQRGTFRDEAERNYRRILKQAGYKAGFGSYSEDWLAILFEYIEQRTTNQLIRLITETTQRNIILLVQQAIQDGIGSEELARAKNLREG